MQITANYRQFERVIDVAVSKYPVPIFKGPCMDCKDRYAGCHGECEKYIMAKAEHDKKCEEIYKVNNSIAEANDYVLKTTRMIKQKVKGSKHRQKK